MCLLGEAEQQMKRWEHQGENATGLAVQTPPGPCSRQLPGGGSVAAMLPSPEHFTRWQEHLLGGPLPVPGCCPRPRFQLLSTLFPPLITVKGTVYLWLKIGCCSNIHFKNRVLALIQYYYGNGCS